MSIFEAVNVPVVFDRIDNFSFEDTKSRELLKKNNCILLGVMVPERGVKAKYNDNHKFYKYLDLYANVNLCFSIPSIKSRHSNVDIAVIRENTEGNCVSNLRRVLWYRARSVSRCYGIVEGHNQKVFGEAD